MAGEPRLTVTWGVFVTALINLVIVAAVLFAIVKAYDAYRARKAAAGEEAPEEQSEEVMLLRRIADAIAPTTGTS